MGILSPARGGAGNGKPASLQLDSILPQQIVANNVLNDIARIAESPTLLKQFPTQLAIPCNDIDSFAREPWKYTE
eukprot:3202273-Rhodomonas_salina.2